MPKRFDYHFEWDPDKAAGNRRKHGVGFELAATVFQDSLALSRFDDEHGEFEERWVTLGQADNGTLLVVVHTYQEIDEHKPPCGSSRRGGPPNASNTITRANHETGI